MSHEMTIGKNAKGFYLSHEGHILLEGINIDILFSVEGPLRENGITIPGLQDLQARRLGLLDI